MTGLAVRADTGHWPGGSRRQDVDAVLPNRLQVRGRSVGDVGRSMTLGLAVRLLGQVRAAWHGQSIRLAGRNATALLALVVLRRRPRSREAIAADLWPDVGTGSAASLRQALWLVRSGLAAAGLNPNAVLDVDDSVIGLQPGVEVDLDAARFEGLLDAHPPRPEEAVAIYGGDLADALDLECFSRDRERLADRYEDALADIAEARLERGDLLGAREAALHLVSRDPLREEGHATLIEVYGQAGSRSQVARQYRRLRSILKAELGVDPLPETEAAYRSAIRRSTVLSARRVAVRGLDREKPMVAVFD